MCSLNVAYFRRRRLDLKNKFIQNLYFLVVPVYKSVNRFFSEIINGTSEKTSIFSYDGKLNEFQCTRTLIAILILSDPMRCIPNKMLHYYWILLLFYFMLAMVQKRCRDLGSKGTWWILVATVIFLIDRAFYFVDINIIDVLWCYLARCNILLGLLMVLLLFLIPSKPAEQQIAANVRSPLLKYPLLYVGVVWILCITATLTVNHFAGVTIPLW